MKAHIFKYDKQKSASERGAKVYHSINLDDSRSQKKSDGKKGGKPTWGGLFGRSGQKRDGLIRRKKFVRGVASFVRRLILKA